METGRQPAVSVVIPAFDACPGTLAEPTATRPGAIGTRYGIALEVTDPWEDVEAPPGIERLCCRVNVEGDFLGVVELPVCDGWVPAAVLADAVAAELAWEILGRFFARTLYPTLTMRELPQGTEVWRGEVRLASGLQAGDSLHDAIGWTVLLQELWGKPEWEGSRFYKAARFGRRSRGGIGLRAVLKPPFGLQKIALRPRPIPPRERLREWNPVEATADLPRVTATGPVDFSVGGAVIGRVEVEGPLGADGLRVALTEAAGFELCRVAVREGILGRPMDGPKLRERLAARHPPEGAAGWVIARRAHGGIGSSASRRAVLPRAAAADLLAAAEVAGEPVLRMGEASERVVYAPDLLWPSPRPERRPTRGAPPRPATPYGRHHFESLFAAAPDPWRYDSPYEQTKYEQTISLLPPGPIPRALELACAEGHFTRRLAARVGHLTAADLSEIALARAAERCREAGNVRFLHLDLARDPLPGGFDLVVCSEVLYYMGSRSDLRAVARRLAGALNPAGHLLTAHAEVAADGPEGPAFDWGLPFGARTIGATLARTPGLRFVREIVTPVYRIQLFRREPRRLPRLFHRPERTERAEHAPLDSALAARLVRGGSRDRKSGEAESVVTDRLPILTYHRVAPEGAASLSRFRLSPEAFEEQIRYLKDAGFRSIDLDEWGDALLRRRPVPGRAVLLTFDDGYRDFAEHAWPILERHGFGATVFLVAERIGDTNRWDAAHGEEVPLLTWEEIRRLHAQGVRFGSHSATHPHLPALSIVEVTREAARSKALLERGLSAPVTAFAYPYGEVDPVVQHLTGACGYLYGLSCRQRPSRLQDPPLLLPRIEVSGRDDRETFLAKLAG